jgi:hypothetical protein
MVPPMEEKFEDVQKDLEEDLKSITDAKVRSAAAFMAFHLEENPEHIEWDGAAKTISLSIGNKEDAETFTRQQFLDFVAECKSYKLDSDRFIRTNGRTLMLVHPESLKAQFICYREEQKLTFSFKKDISLHFHANDPLVQYVAVKNGSDFEYLPAYASLAIQYSAKQKHIPDKEEEQLLESLMFELASTEDIVFSKNELIRDFEEDPFYEFEGQKFAKKLRPLECFNEGMRLYLAAANVAGLELQLLSYYKVLEFFAPIVLALESNEALRKRLDSPAALNPDGNYLQSIFELARATERRKNDKEMIRLVLETCVDFVDVSRLLPKPLAKTLSPDDKKGLAEHSRVVAEALYATRNQVAHAKSNYELQGTEISAEYLPELIKFVQAAAVRAVRWYNRLPTHLKLTF